MPADRLERLPDAGSYVAIIDHQRSTAAIRNTPADLHRLGVATPFEDRARARGTELCRQQGLEKWQWFRGDCESKLVACVDLDPALVPAAVRFHGLVDRQRVKEFIGKNNRRSCGHVGELRMPENRYAHIFQRFFLLCLKHRADLDQMRDDRGMKFRHDLHRAQRVIHQSATSGTELDQPYILWRAHLRPHGRSPQADQFAEHLAYFWRCRKVSTCAKRIARGVVAVLTINQAERHVLRERHWPCRGNAAADFGLEWRAVRH